jgi:hypothetical protein
MPDINDQITCIIPIVARPSHPDSYVLDQTLNSIRERLPTCEIILMFDGVSDTLMHLKKNYEIFQQQLLWRINNEMTNVTPLVFTEHKHQSLMTKEALKIVRTPLVLWSEEDTYLVGDIPFAELSEVVLAGYANSIRFHHEATIPESHTHLMLDPEPITILGQPLIRTRQWAGRPSIISTKFFKDIADKYWDDQPRFIEHIMYGIAAEGGDNYEEFRLHIYAPPGGTYVRHKHMDGRRYGADHYDPNPS